MLFLFPLFWIQKKPNDHLSVDAVKPNISYNEINNIRNKTKFAAHCSYSE